MTSHGDSYVAYVKVALAIALLRKKEKSVRADEYVRQIQSSLTANAAQWKDRYQELNRELLRIKSQQNLIPLFEYCEKLSSTRLINGLASPVLPTPPLSAVYQGSSEAAVENPKEPQAAVDNPKEPQDSQLKSNRPIRTKLQENALHLRLSFKQLQDSLHVHKSAGVFEHFKKALLQSLELLKQVLQHIFSSPVNSKRSALGPDVPIPSEQLAVDDLGKASEHLVAVLNYHKILAGDPIHTMVDSIIDQLFEPLLISHRTRWLMHPADYLKKLSSSRLCRQQYLTKGFHKLKSLITHLVDTRVKKIYVNFELYTESHAVLDLCAKILKHTRGHLLHDIEVEEALDWSGLYGMAQDFIGHYPLVTMAFQRLYIASEPTQEEEVAALFA